MGLLGRGCGGTERESLPSLTTTAGKRNGGSNSNSGGGNSIEEACVGGGGKGEHRGHDVTTKPKQESLRGGETRGSASAKLRPPSREEGGRRLSAADETEISAEAMGRGAGTESSDGDSLPTTRNTYAEAALRRLKRARGALEEALDELGRSTVDELGLAPPAYMDLHFPFPPSGEEEDFPEGGEELEEGREGKGTGKESVGWLRQWKKRGELSFSSIYIYIYFLFIFPLYCISYLYI